MKAYALFAGLLLAARLGQTADTEDRLTIRGAVERPLSLSRSDLAGLRRVTLRVDDHGKTVLYEGVALADLLQKAGAPLGAKLHGTALASYVLATGKDGYQVVFALAECDPGMTDKRILVADRSDGTALAGGLGPLRLVVEGDKRMARSVRMLQRIEVMRLGP